MQILLRKLRCVASTSSRPGQSRNRAEPSRAQEACFTDDSDTQQKGPFHTGVVAWRRRWNRSRRAVECALCRTRLALNEEQSFHYGNNVEIIEQTTHKTLTRRRRRQQHPEILAAQTHTATPTKCTSLSAAGGNEADSGQRAAGSGQLPNVA